MAGADKQALAEVLRFYKTAVFKIHNPSRRKRALLDDSLRRGHLAFSKVLRIMTAKIEDYAALDKGARRSVLERDARRIVRSLPLGRAAKEGVVDAVAAQINSYIASREADKNAGMPACARISADSSFYADALEDFTAGVLSQEKESAARLRLLTEQKSGGLRPILFPGYRRDDGFLVLHHPLTGKYAVWLNLHPKESRFAKPVALEGWLDWRTRKSATFRSATGCLFPVEFAAEYQRARFLEKGTPKTAKLVKRGESYEIHIAFAFESQKVVTTTTMGVERGLYNLASFCAIDRDGRILHRENVDALALRKRQIAEEKQQQIAQKAARQYRSRKRGALADETVYSAANRIVAAALRYRAQVVLGEAQRHKRRGKGRAYINRVLNRAQYAKLADVLEYKLKEGGLPGPKIVTRYGAPETCPRCGRQSPENRADLTHESAWEIPLFFCGACGYANEADINTARILGLRKIWRDELPAHVRAAPNRDLPEELRFDQFLRIRAARRGCGPDTFGGRDLGEGRTGPRLL